MAYIHTSKTRRRSPHGKTVTIENHLTGEIRVTDERAAEKKGNKPGWSEPTISPVQANK